MNSDKQLLEQALEALEVAQDNLRPHGDNCFLHDDGEYNRCFCGKDSLVSYLQDAVEKLDTAIKQTLVAPVQEPVAWRFDQAKYRENDLRGRQWAFNVFSQTKPYMDEMVQNVTPLYTTQPAAQRQWVGLTDDEIIQCTPNWIGTLEDVARAVETKLKEKNG